VGSQEPSGDPGEDFYALLELPPDASEEAIRKAITAQRRVWRRRTTAPDINARQEAERRMQALDDAERTLLDRPAPAQRSAPPKPEPAPQPSGLAREWLVRAAEHLKTGETELALFTARRAVDEDPQNAYAWSVLADAAARADDSATAQSAIERALALEPEEAYLHAERGWILDRSGRSERAVAAYRTAVKLDPSRIDYRVRTVTALLRAGRVDEAVREGEEAYRARPDDGDVRTALGTALAERAVAAQHELADGRLVISSENQANYVLALASRGLSVNPADPSVRADLEKQRDYATRARRRKFSRPAFRRNWRWPVGLGLILVAGGCCAPNIYRITSSGDLVQRAFGAGVLIVLLTFVGALLYTCFEPAYRRNAALIAREVPARVGRGPGDRGDNRSFGMDAFRPEEPDAADNGSGKPADSPRAGAERRGGVRRWMSGGR
jgi:tetratricopeptide (TPR) repeat protein